MKRFDVENDDVDDEVFTQAETSIDLPDVPIAGTQTLKEIRTQSVTISYLRYERTQILLDV